MGTAPARTTVRFELIGSRRAAVLIALGVLCTVTLAPHVRLYVEQEQQQAALEAEIVEREAAVSELQGQLDLWQDDAYVAAQARDRLHYIFPGETAYVVRTADGTEEVAAAEAAAAEAAQGPWYRRLWPAPTETDR